MPVDFRSLLKDNSQSVSRPKSAPTCWLIGTLGGVTFDTTKGENETPYASFEILNVERHPDTEEELLEGVNLKNLRSPFRKTLAADFWLTPDAKYHLANMLDRVIGDPERSLEERIPETRNRRVMFKVTPHKNQNSPDEDSGQNSVDGRTMTNFE
jgi:hypothetical protein